MLTYNPNTQELSAVQWDAVSKTETNKNEREGEGEGGKGEIGREKTDRERGEEERYRMKGRGEHREVKEEERVGC